MCALIQSNLGIDAEQIATPMAFAEAFAKAMWIEEFRLRNQAELLATMFGGKVK